ncbi:MAG: cob(I)yrinic acid a,c-diamide adenosyltransferase [Rikenellaceae bacterium]|nr:cob(I)yrinic acid a,c-diamide adenosyltransferase [Rikenellaceae bacterium]
MKIYTKGGDKGKTGLRGGVRVEKDDIRIETNGTLDELNSWLGIVRSFLGPDHPWQPILTEIQQNLIRMISRIATPEHLLESNPNRVNERLPEILEQEIDRITGQSGPCAHFILPGGPPAAAFLHGARTVARRSERRLYTLGKSYPCPDLFLKILNRLSDLLFVMARHESLGQGYAEEQIHRFSTRREKNNPGR